MPNKNSKKNPVKEYAMSQGMLDKDGMISAKDLDKIAEHFHTNLYVVMYYLRFGK